MKTEKMLEIVQGTLGKYFTDDLRERIMGEIRDKCKEEMESKFFPIPDHVYVDQEGEAYNPFPPTAKTEERQRQSDAAAEALRVARIQIINYGRGIIQSQQLASRTGRDIETVKLQAVADAVEWMGFINRDEYMKEVHAEPIFEHILVLRRDISNLLSAARTADNHGDLQQGD